jgi:hypothetical protein
MRLGTLITTNTGTDILIFCIMIHLVYLQNIYAIRSLADTIFSPSLPRSPNVAFRKYLSYVYMWKT